jgi:hypothetical protein
MLKDDCGIVTKVWRDESNYSMSLKLDPPSTAMETCGFFRMKCSAETSLVSHLNSDVGIDVRCILCDLCGKEFIKEGRNNKRSIEIFNELTIGTTP